MIAVGGLGDFDADEIGPIEMQAPNGVVDVVVPDEAAAVGVTKKLLAYFQGPVPSGAVPDRPAEQVSLPPRRPGGLPRWARWVLPLALLAVVAGIAGLFVHRERTAPSPYTYTCPGGQVVAFSYECDRLAPSAPATP